MDGAPTGILGSGPRRCNIRAWFQLALLLALAGSIVSTARRHRLDPSEGAFRGFIDRTGRARIVLQSGQDASSFSEGLAAVSLNGKHGYIDTIGAWVIPPRFAVAHPFSDGLAQVALEPAGKLRSKNSLFGYIDKTGRFVIPPLYSGRRRSAEGSPRSALGLRRRIELCAAGLDRQGQSVLRPRWAAGTPFSDGRAWVAGATREKRWTLIDRVGQPVTPNRFAWANPFTGGLAATEHGSVYVNGRVAIPRPLDFGEEGFSEGWARIRGDRAVFIDRLGEVVLRTNYRDAGLVFGRPRSGLPAGLRRSPPNTTGGTLTRPPGSPSLRASPIPRWPGAGLLELPRSADGLLHVTPWRSPPVSCKKQRERELFVELLWKTDGGPCVVSALPSTGAAADREALPHSAIR